MLCDLTLWPGKETYTAVGAAGSAGSQAEGAEHQGRPRLLACCAAGGIAQSAVPPGVHRVVTFCVRCSCTGDSRQQRGRQPAWLCCRNSSWLRQDCSRSAQSPCRSDGFRRCACRAGAPTTQACSVVAVLVLPNAKAPILIYTIDTPPTSFFVHGSLMFPVFFTE